MKLRAMGGTGGWLALLLLTGCGPAAAGHGLGRQRHQDHRRPRSATSPTPSASAADEAAKAGGSRGHGHRRAVNQQSLCLLIDAELSQQYAETEGLEPRQAPGGRPSSASSSRSSPTLPEKPRTVLEDLFTRLGRRAATSSSRSAARRPVSSRASSNVEQLLNAGLQARGEVAEERPTSTPTRATHPARTASPAAATASVSEAGSDFAKDAGAEEPDPDVGRRAAGQPEVRLMPWRAHRPEPSASPTQSPLIELVEIMARLRAECGWKAAQTHRTLAKHLLEETYETLEAIEALDDGGSPDHLREELGDVLLQVYLHAAIAAQAGRVRHRGRRRGAARRRCSGATRTSSVTSRRPTRPGSTRPGSRSRPRRSSAPACSTGSRSSCRR